MGGNVKTVRWEISNRSKESILWSFEGDSGKEYQVGQSSNKKKGGMIDHLTNKHHIFVKSGGELIKLTSVEEKLLNITSHNCQFTS